MTAAGDWGLDGFAFGISIAGPTHPGEWARGLEWVDRAEAAGLHSVWVPEMHFSPTGNAAPLLCLAAVAARTRHARVATTSVLLPIHHPLRLAAEAIAVDRLSGGRLILGLGRGFSAPLFEAFGVDPTDKRDRFDESLDAILAVFRGEAPDLSGGPFDAGPLAPTRSACAPEEGGAPALGVAAFGRKGLGQAARRGLPYLASPMEPFDLIAENHAHHRALLPDHVDAADLPVPVMRTVFVTEDRAQAQAVLDAHARENRLPRGVKLPPALARAAAAAPEERIVVGGAQDVIERIASYRGAIGLDLLILRPQVVGVDDAARQRSFDRLVSEVEPALRARPRDDKSVSRPLDA